MSTPPFQYQLRPKRLHSYPPTIPPSHNKHLAQHVQDPHPLSYSDSCTSRLPISTNFSGPFGRYKHTIDPEEGRYCKSPEPISRERGGDLDFSGVRARLRRLMRMVKREEMRRKGNIIEGEEEKSVSRIPKTQRDFEVQAFGY
jgi:hypothetical protein